MAKKTKTSESDKKQIDLAPDIEKGEDTFMTTDQGVKINDDTNSLKAGERGPSLLEDFILREKITHFDHERIPERIVHARGSAAHGYFQVYESMSKYTKAGFLQDPSVKTPVFVRFSTVAGFRGSTDLARDVRGFSVKFYTEEGNYDLVGNNIPVFFIQDAIKFPDLIHAVKPEPHNEIPQAASAHDTFWDFISLTPEAMHMIMWTMSDRAIPRSLRMMEGFGVHTFRFINDKGVAHFVKFHWKPLLGVHGVLWDEAQKISGMDTDFHRRDLYEAIQNGNFPEWEFGVQIIPEKDEHKYDFDLLDPTKLVPEEIVPVQRIGKMVLNRNPDNFFAETEQVAFHPGHLVPGIDFTNDPLLQGRLFSYTDTQLSRLGSPNFHEIPINQSINPVHNNQRDGHMRQQINSGQTSYHPNTLGGGCPYQAKTSEGGFSSYQEKIDASKVRARSKSFMDFFSQAALFYNSQTEMEQYHIVKALQFELGKVQTISIRQRMVGMLAHIDKQLAQKVAEGLGLDVEPLNDLLNHNFGADANPGDYQNHPPTAKRSIKKSPALSMANTQALPETRQVAILVADGVDAISLKKAKTAMEKAGVTVKIIAPKSGHVKDSKHNDIMIDMSLLTTSSVLFDAVFLPDGEQNNSALMKSDDAIHFINETFKHCKSIAIEGMAMDLLKATYLTSKTNPKTTKGLFIEANFKDSEMKSFIDSIPMRFYEREKQGFVPA